MQKRIFLKTHIASSVLFSLMTSTLLVNTASADTNSTLPYDELKTVNTNIGLSIENLSGVTMTTTQKIEDPKTSVATPTNIITQPIQPNNTVEKIKIIREKAENKESKNITFKPDNIKTTISVTTEIQNTPSLPIIQNPIKDPKDNDSTLTDGQAVERDSSKDTSNDEVIDSINDKDGKSYTTVNLTKYAKRVNSARWVTDMNKNTAMTVKLQALLDWNHASPGPVDGGWGMNSQKALKNFQAMKGLKTTGKMNQATWNALNKNVDQTQPVLYSYKIRRSDTKYFYTKIPSGYPAKSKLKALNYQSIQEKLAEKHHMNINYLEKLNPNKRFKVGEEILVYNAGNKLKSRITKVVANKADKTLYAYNGKKLVATYPTTVGSAATPSPHGTFKIANSVKKPYYKATVGEGRSKKTYMLRPGPNSPVGIVWMGLSKPTYGIHGSPVPEGISRQASHGCIRLTNWDALEVQANIKQGATVVLK